MHPLIEPLDALVLDLDGVIYRGDKTIDGSPDAVRRLREAGKKLLFMTNNSTRLEADVIKKLSDHGIVASEHEILTSARVTTDVLISRGLSDRGVYLLGGDGIRTALAEAGFEIVSAANGAGADIVVVGADRSFDYERLRVAADAVRNGAMFIATNSDPSFPTPTGLVPGAGALVAAIEVASGRSAEVLGKPQAPMMEAAARRLGSTDSIGIVGDQPATDLDGGRAMAWTTILVLSGVIEAGQAELVKPAPDLIVENLGALVLGQS